MNNLAIKEVDFQGDVLLACEKDDKIYVGVKWVAEGVGLSVDQIKNERKKIQSDLVLQQGGRNLTLPTNGGIQDVLCIELEFLPLWLAKISITPKMQKENPFVVNKLVEYQLKAKDVLAQAFIKNSQVSNELMFLQGLLDGMKEQELKVKRLEEQNTLTSNKVVYLETEFNKETVEVGYKSNDNVGRNLNLYSLTNKPHASFVDAIAKHLKIYNTNIGYKDEYVNVVRSILNGGTSSASIYYSEEAIQMMMDFVNKQFKPVASEYKRGVNKGKFKDSVFELNGKTYKFNEKTFKFYS